MKLPPFAAIAATAATLAACDLVIFPTDNPGPDSLLRNGSFEVWDSTGPVDWSIADPGGATYTRSGDTPRDGGSYSLLIRQEAPNPRAKLSQGVRIDRLAERVKLDLWAHFASGGSAVLVVRPAGALALSDTIVNLYLPTDWEEYSTVIHRTVRPGDSAFVELRGGVTYFDKMELVLLN